MCKEFKCPACGAINEQTYFDSLDQEIYNDKVIIKYYGYCGKCGVNLRWEETYSLLGYYNIKVTED